MIGFLFLHLFMDSPDENNSKNGIFFVVTYFLGLIIIILMLIDLLCR